MSSTPVIPVVDVSPAFGDDPDALATCMAQLRHALTEVGFLQVVGHRVDPTLVEAAYTAMAQIAALPEAERRALVRPRSSSRGLFEEIDDRGRVLNRALQFMRYDDLAAAESDDAVGGHPDYFVPNVWPEQLPGFRTTWKAYDAATRSLAGTLMGLFALAMGLPRDFFAEPFAKDVSLFGVNLYPPQPVDDEDVEKVVLNPHADSGGLTVLHQRGTYEGLQVRDADGGWVTVPLREDAFVINIGHLMSRWTNGRFPATVHRVVAGPDTSAERQSIAMFFLPTIDLVVAPVETMVGPEGPQYLPVTAYDWQEQFMKEYVLVNSYAEPVG